jgi:hypothetical protein
MRWAVTLPLGVALVACALGCRSNCDQVEAELRARENDVHVLRAELSKAEFYNHAMQREVFALRGLPGHDGIVHKPTEPYPVRSIVLGRQTGGHPSDHGGDDALQVMVEPRDPEDHAIKAPGALYVEALEVSTEGLKHSLSAWEVPPEQLRTSWQQGLFTTGYLVCLPWKNWPSTEKLRVVARLKLLDGRVFEADKDVTIRVAPGHQRRTPAEPPPSITPAPAPTQPAPSPPPSSTAPQVLPPPMPVAPQLPPRRKEPPPPSPPTPSTPAPNGPALDQAVLQKQSVLLRPAAEILRPTPAP